MFKNLISKLLSRAKVPPKVKEYLNYLKTADPQIQNYQIKKNRLIPKRELSKRYRRIRELFPDPMNSFLDVSSSKGFFVFSASEFPECTRSLGIESYQYDIEVCRWLKDYLHNDVVQFEFMRLDELAERIEEFGGPFQTVLVANVYQHFYFGSSRYTGGYLSHDDIFKNLRKLCSERIIFNNQVNLEDCQNTNLDKNSSNNVDYSAEKLLEAASKYFHIVPHGSIGGHPLWTMDVKEAVASTVFIPELKDLFDLWTNDLSFREAFKQNPEHALLSAGFNFDATKLQKIKSMLKQHAIKNEDLDKRISR
ncbi:MAG TPA: hypothetical protein VHA13_05925 [Gammaproteobacteria bacterium]|nr:hypothetical protein [Gammaproteobacteria bacterium]